MLCNIYYTKHYITLAKSTSAGEGLFQLTGHSLSMREVRKNRKNNVCWLPHRPILNYLPFSSFINKNHFAVIHSEIKYTTQLDQNSHLNKWLPSPKLNTSQ